MKKTTYKLSAALLMSALLGSTLMACQKAEGPAEKAGKEVDQAVDKAGNKIDNATDKVGEQIEKAGEKIQDTAKDNK